MPDTCDFEFDRTEPVYYSGETINGHIKLRTTQDQEVRAVFIDFRGEAAVHWEERKSRQTDGFFYIEEYSASETYLHTRTLVVREGTLHAGAHVYPFCIPLPEQSPTSSIEIYGQISYVLSLLVLRLYGMNNEYQHPLMVLRQLNLNLHSEYWLPLKNEDIKYFCCWPCSSGPVITTFSIPMGAYAPGQQIKYTFEIDNQSSDNDLYGILIQLLQTYKFIARTPHYKVLYHSNTLAKSQHHEHYLRLTRSSVEGVLTIPPVPPSSQNSGIITVRYDLKMTIFTSAFHRDSEIMLPLTIGTVPLTPVATIVTSQANARPWRLANMSSSAKPPSYDNYMPPSFEEATSTSTQGLDNTNAEEPFVPKYPIFTNITPTAPPVEYYDASNV